MTEPMPDNSMASKGEGSATERSIMQRALETVRERYVEEHGEEPPEEFMEEVRRKIILGVARRDRDAHRDIYDALADE